MSAVAQPSRRVLADVVADTIAGAARPATRARAVAIDTVLVLAGVAVVALLAKVSFFIGPVPITGQTAGVIIVGAALGARRGATSLALYAALGLAGAPVFAGAVAGPAYVLVPSFGFVLGFIPAAFVAGWFAERAWDRRPLRAFLGFVAASIVPFLIGVPYLAFVLAVVLGQPVSFAAVMEAGVIPFILPGIVKAAVVALAVPAAWKLVSSIETRR